MAPGPTFVILFIVAAQFEKKCRDLREDEAIVLVSEWNKLCHCEHI